MFDKHEIENYVYQPVWSTSCFCNPKVPKSIMESVPLKSRLNRLSTSISIWKSQIISPLWPFWYRQTGAGGATGSGGWSSAAGCGDGRSATGCGDGRSATGCGDGRSATGCGDGRSATGCGDGRSATAAPPLCCCYDRINNENVSFPAAPEFSLSLYLIAVSSWTASGVQFVKFNLQMLDIFIEFLEKGTFDTICKNTILQLIFRISKF